VVSLQSWPSWLIGSPPCPDLSAMGAACGGMTLAGPPSVAKPPAASSGLVWQRRSLTILVVPVEDLRGKPASVDKRTDRQCVPHQERARRPLRQWTALPAVILVVSFAGSMRTLG
jgi:hypothetical protein